MGKLFFILFKFPVWYFIHLDFLSPLRLILTSCICLENYRRRQWHPTPVLLPGKSHGWRSLVGFSPWGCKESDTTEQLHSYFSHSCIGEGNGNPLHCSCLENPRDGRAWWAAISGVTQSQTRLTQLSSRKLSALLFQLYLQRMVQSRFL